MANLHAVAFVVTLLFSLPVATLCARLVAMTGAVSDSGYSAIAVPNRGSCSTDFSQVSYEEVKAACPAGAAQGASPACCAAFNNKACQYEAEVNDLGSSCPMLFISYLNVAGAYPAGYFVGPCVDGTNGFCVRK